MVVRKEEISQDEKILVDIGDGVLVKVEVADTGREKVKAGALPFEQVAAAITKISEVVSTSIQSVKPTKAIVKYGIEVGIEQGSLMATIVRGTGKANLEITLEWENKATKEEKK